RIRVENSESRLGRHFAEPSTTYPQRAEMLGKLVSRFSRHFNNEAAIGLREQAKGTVRKIRVIPIECCSETARDAHLCQSRRYPAFADVATGHDQAAADRFMKYAENTRPCRHIDLWDRTVSQTIDQVEI